MAFAPQGVLSSGVVRELSPRVVLGWGTGSHTEEGGLLTEVAESGLDLSCGRFKDRKA